VERSTVLAAEFITMWPGIQLLVPESARVVNFKF